MMTLNQRKREDRRINTEAHHDRISELLWAGLAGETDAVFEGATFGQGGGIVSECFEKVEEEGLGFAFFVAFEFGGELSESVERLFLRGHLERNDKNFDESHEGTERRKPMQPIQGWWTPFTSSPRVAPQDHERGNRWAE